MANSAFRNDKIVGVDSSQELFFIY